MNNRNRIIAGIAAVIMVFGFIWWRSRPINRAERLLAKTAETASVTAEDGEILRRMKLEKLRNYIGYELHVDVEGITKPIELMQDEALSVWAYIVGRKRYLSVEFLDVEVISAEKEMIKVNAEISVDSNYEKGRYSKKYPVVIDLKSVERKLRVISLKTLL